MKITEGKIKGLLVIEPKVFNDDRGYFFESFNQKIWSQYFNGKPPVFVQDNESLSSKNTLRGLHFQNPPHAQGKLVRVTNGSVLDVAVDLRKGSKTYGKHEKIVLSEENKLQFYIPEGFAHGFLALEENTRFIYKCTDFYNPNCEESILWSDKNLAIDWGNNSPQLSPKDKEAQNFINFESKFFNY